MITPIIKPTNAWTWFYGCKLFFFKTLILNIFLFSTPILLSAQSCDGGPCDAIRWTSGGAWNLDASVDDNTPAGDAIEDQHEDIRGIIKCASAASTQSNIDENSCYNSSSFEIDVSGLTCIDPSSGNILVVTNPTEDEPIIWLNFDVRANAGTFDIQINDNSGDNIGWALYASLSPTFGTSLAASGEFLSGDCSDLELVSCGVESSSTWNTIPVPNFPAVSNYYLALWDQDADGEVRINNFKGRFGCGNSDFCFIQTTDLTTECLADSYKVSIDIAGLNGTYELSDNTGQGTNISPSSITLTNSQDANPAVAGSFCITYPLGVSYDISINETSGSDVNPNIPCTLNEAGVAPDCPCGSCVVDGPNGPVVQNSQQIFTAPIAGTCVAPIYSWTISGNGTIIGATNSSSVTVEAGAAIDGSYTVESSIACDDCVPSPIVCSKMIEVDTDSPPDISITCPLNLNLGSFNCNQGNPAFPTLMFDDVSNTFTIDNTDGDYGIVLVGNIIGNVEINTTDDFPNFGFCADADQRITRTVNIFDDRGDGNGGAPNGLLDADETEHTCVFTFTIEPDVEIPNINCPSAISDLTCDETAPTAATTIAEFLALDGASAVDNCTATSNLTISHTDVSIKTQSFVSDESFLESTVSTPGGSAGALFNGVAGVLPAENTFTIVPTFGSNPTQALPGTQSINSGSDIKYYRKSFNLLSDDAELDLELNVDNQVEIYLNSILIAREESWDVANFQGPPYHRIFIQLNSISNGYESGQSFDFANSDTNTPFFNVGENELIFVVRNPAAPDIGGLSVRASIVESILPTSFTFCAADAPFEMTRTYSIGDACGNVATCEQLITWVTDIEIPNAVCKDLIVELDENGEYILDAALLNDASSDNCTSDNELEFLASKTRFTCDDLDLLIDESCSNVQIVTLTVIDNCGNENTCSANVTVRDNLPPALTVPTDFTVTLPSGACEQIVNFVLPSATDNCDASPILEKTVGLDLTSGSSFEVGVYSFTYQAIDQCGNVATESFTISVQAANSTGDLSCNTGGVDISLDADCEAEVTPEDLLEGSSYGCSTDFQVDLFFDPNFLQPVPGSPTVTGAYIGMTLYARISSNGNSCSGPITVKDGQIPDLTCEDFEASCEDDITPVIGEAMDFPFSTDVIISDPINNEYTVQNFDGCSAVTLSYFDIITDIDCQTDPDNLFTQIITRTWTAMDASGNTTSCEQTISLTKIGLGDINFPLDYAEDDGRQINVVPEPTNFPPLNCEQRMPMSVAACGAVLGWNVIQPGDYPGDLYVGNPSPLDALYDCGDVKWFGTGTPSGGACGNINFTFQDIRINVCDSGASSGCFKIDRTWTVQDMCTGEMTTHLQQIFVEDNVAPVVTGLEDVTISTNSFDCTGTYIVPIPEILDNCSDLIDGYLVTSSNGLVTYDSDLNQYVISEMEAFMTHAVNVRAEDCCGNVVNFSFNITVEDQVIPSVVCESFVTTSLVGDGTSKILAGTFDEGSMDACQPVFFKVLRMDHLNGTINGSVEDQSGLRCQNLNGDDDAIDDNQIYFDDFILACCEDIDQEVMVILRVFDVNPGTGPIDPSRMDIDGDLFGRFNECMVTLNVNDKTAPRIEAPTDLTISCDYWYDIQSLEDPTDDTFGKIVSGTSSSVETRNNIVLFDRWCDDNVDNIDGMGSTQFDSENPTQTFQKILGRDGLVYDNCQSNVQVSIEIENDLSCGQGTLKRIFTATDDAGRTGTAEQLITVVNCSPFFITDTNCQNENTFDGIVWPCDFTSTTCGQGTLPSITGLPLINDQGACDMISMTYDDEIFPVVNGACFKIIRTWTVSDWCQMSSGSTNGRWEYVQYIKVINSDAPDFSDFVLGDLSYNSDCTINQQLRITVNDQCTPNELLTVDFKLDVNNDGQFDFIGSNLSPYPYANQMNLPVINVSYIPNADGSYRAGVVIPSLPLLTNHRIVWGSEDQCSNLASSSNVFSIEDTEMPTVHSIGDVTLELNGDCELQLVATDFDMGSIDNCGVTQRLITLEDAALGQSNPPATAGNELLINIDQLGPNTLYLWISDEAGNWSFGTLNLMVADSEGNCFQNTTGIISGEIITEEYEPACHIPVELKASNGMADQIETNAEGDFELSGNLGQNYSVVPEKLDDMRKGISTLDLILISRHLIGLQPLNSPYKLIAADVNNDQVLNAFDLIDLQKVILYLYDEFPNNKSFRFIDANYNFGTNSPYDFPYAEQVDINGLSQNEIANFIAVKTGDVDGSIDMNFDTNPSNRSGQNILNFQIDDLHISAGEEYTVKFKTREYNDLFGYQFSLAFDANVLQFLEAVGEKSNVQFGTQFTDSGRLTLSYGNVETESFEDGAVAFRVKFRAKRSGMLSELLKVNNSQFMLAEAYTQHLDHMAVGLNFSNDKSIDFELLQNKPNPFKDATEISFILPHAAEATLTIYDVAGRRLKVIEGNYDKGYNKVTLRTAELDVPMSIGSVLYYQLNFSDDQVDVDEFSAFKKMIIIE